MDHHQSLSVQLVEMIMAIEMKIFGKTNAQVLCMGSMSRQFYKHSFNCFHIRNPNPYPKMLNAKIMQSSLSF